MIRDAAIELWTNDKDGRRNFRKEVPHIQTHYIERAKRILLTEKAGSWATASFALSDSWYLDGIDRRHKDPQHALKRLFPLSLNSYQEQRMDMNVTQEKWDVQTNDWKNMESVFGTREENGALHNDIILRHTNQLQCRSGKSRIDRRSGMFNYLQFNNRHIKRDGENFVKISRRYGVGRKGTNTIVLTSNASQKLQVGFKLQISEALKSVVSEGTSVVAISTDGKTLTLSKPLLNDLVEKITTNGATSLNSNQPVTGYHIERIRCPGLVEYSNRKRSGESRRETTHVKRKKTTTTTIKNYIMSSEESSTMMSV